MKALDLFCGGGGAAEGLVRAGFEVVGVDSAKHENYKYVGKFIQYDVFEYLYNYGSCEFDFIWASPPCQGYSSHVSSSNSQWVPYSQGKETPKLISKTRDVLVRSEVPYAIENVLGSIQSLNNPHLLCGTMFGLPISRHRLIETSFPLLAPHHETCSGVAKRFSDANGIDYRDMSITGKSRRSGCIQTWLKLLGCRHQMTASECAESIPPAYSEFIANQFMRNSCK